MKKQIFLWMFLLLFGLSCSVQEDDFKSNGTITGIDIRECSCCGGYFIEIGDSTYRFDTVPPGSTLKLENRTFPVYVQLDWNEDPNACLGDEIIVTRIEER